MKIMCKHVWFDQDTTKVVKHVTCLAQAHKVCKITVTQFNSKINYQVPLSAVNNKVALEFKWTAGPEDRPRWAYTAWNPHIL